MIAFAKTKADRLASGDPRTSIEERYASLAVYMAKVKDDQRFSRKAPDAA
jgi:hypothetical protein